MNEALEVWNYKDYLTNYVQNRYKFFTFIYNDDKIEKHELSLRKEDFLSDVLIRGYNKYHLYDSSKSKLGSWLCNIATNLYIDMLRKNKVANKYTKEIMNTVETSTLELDLDSFKEYLIEYKPHLYSFLIRKEEDLDKEDIKLELSLDNKQYNILDKELKQEWETFNN
jgi:hypothetical protein